MAEGSSVTVAVELDVAPEREVVIPLVAANQGGASSLPTTAPCPPASPSLPPRRRRRSPSRPPTTAPTTTARAFRFTFGTLPSGVSEGSTDETVISITDDDAPSVVVSFAQDAYTVAEGSSVTVAVELDVAPEREVVIPLVATNQGGATSADYGTLPTSVTFSATETAKTFTFTATDDSADDDGERVRFSFGTLPTAASARVPPTRPSSVLPTTTRRAWW